MPPPRPRSLPDELLEEIFLRLPPDDPACLVRTSLTSKPWLSLLTGPRFHGRYREFHGSPPMLGFLYSSPWRTGSTDEVSVLSFVSTTSFGARVPDDMDAITNNSVRDCRHGRVLFCNIHRAPMLLVVWDPMTGCRRELEVPKAYSTQGVAVLCAVSGCDHVACHHGPSRVVFVGLDDTHDGYVAYAHVSTPEAADWSKSCSALDLAVDRAVIVCRPPAFIQDALYFMITIEDGYDDDDVDTDIAILMYDLGTNCLSLIYAPTEETNPAGGSILMALEDGGLGFAQLDRLTIKLWSRQTGSDGVLAWTRRIVVNLEEFPPIQNFKKMFGLIGSVEGRDIIFVTTNLRIYEINLKSLQCKKLCKRERYHALFPYMSFYDPSVINL